jgi:hypothetical protein
VTTNPQPISGAANGYTVELSSLSTHHQQLGAVVDQLADALGTALGTHLPVKAFGRYGAPLAEAIEPTAEAAKGAFERVVEAVGANRDGVDLTVRTYDEFERSNAGTFQNVLE